MTTWSKDPFGIYGLILTPTRELAIQIAEQFKALGASVNMRTAVIVGGVNMTEQALELQRKPHFVIATPGRLADHIKNSGEETISGLRRVKYLVLDEADRLLSNTFGTDLATCFDVLPSSDERQTLLFTATVTDAVRSLKDKPLAEGKLPIAIHEIDTVDQMILPKRLTSSYLMMPEYVKESYLHNLLTHPDNENKSAIVFVNRIYSAELLGRMLRKLNVRCTSLHSSLAQSERINALQRFRAQAARVLIATDVAGRGLDIPVVELVVNYDIPASADDYIHRVGRTARAGKKGEAISFISPKDVTRIENIEEKTGQKLEKYNTITDDTVIKDSLSETRVAKREAIVEMEKEHFGEKKRLQKKKAGLLVERGQRKEKQKSRKNKFKALAKT